MSLVTLRPVEPGALMDLMAKGCFQSISNSSRMANLSPRCVFFTHVGPNHHLHLVTPDLIRHPALKMLEKWYSKWHRLACYSISIAALETLSLLSFSLLSRASSATLGIGRTTPVRKACMSIQLIVVILPSFQLSVLQINILIDNKS